MLELKIRIQAEELQHAELIMNTPKPPIIPAGESFV